MFNPMCGQSVTKLVELGVFPDGDKSVIELGSQTLAFKLEADPSVTDVPSFYKALGFDGYEAVDFNGKGTQQLDLNQILEGPIADLVTNNGTSEHIFNQAALFQNMHSFCKPGGVMLHLVPWLNWQNHGFFNYNPILFMDLASVNNYEVLLCYAGDRDGNILIEPVPASEIKNPVATEQNVLLVVAMKKVQDSPFVFPIQGKYKDTDKTPVTPKQQPLWKGLLIESMGELETDPFVHATGVLQPEMLDGLENIWPSEIPVLGDNLLSQLAAAESLQHITGPLKSFVDYHTSDAFFQELMKWCGPHIMEKHPNLMELPPTAGVRYRDEATVQMDVIFCEDAPSKKKATVKPMHVDNPLEMYKFLIRFPGNGYERRGGIELGQWKEGVQTYDKKPHKRLAKKDSYDVVNKIKDEPGSILFYLNDANALHAVKARKSAKKRRYLNIMGECPR